ncbi:MAG: SixA phosphatase family protein [Actinomycetota bacterium]
MRLWLLRHAKSSWDDPALEDRDRPLSPRGERAADRMCGYLDAEGIRPGLVLCSSALRTRQTLARVFPALGPELVVRIEPSVYASGATGLLDRLRRVPDDVAAVMLIGHNPAIQELAARLASPGERLDRLTQKFPTGGLAEIEFHPGGWHGLAEQQGELTRFVIPRELDTPDE